MHEAVILHSVDDAVHSIAHGYTSGRHLWTTNAGVSVYLKEKYNLDCRCLSEFVSDSIAINNIERSALFADELMTKLDNEVSATINRHLGTRMNWMSALYAYPARHQLVAYMNLAHAIEQASKQNHVNRLVVYQYRFNHFLDTSSECQFFADAVLPHINTQIVKTEKAIRFSGSMINWIIKRAIQPDFIIKYVLDKLFTRWRFSKTKSGQACILLSESLYELSFLKEALRDQRVLLYEYERKAPVGFKEISFHMPAVFSETDFRTNNTGDLYRNALAKDISEDFLNNYQEYLETVLILQRIRRDYPVAVGVWGLPPVQPKRAILFEYLLSENIPVIGAQHGGSYCEQFAPKHYLTDFNRCDYFISYGFTGEDLNRTYPGEQSRALIMPLGKVKKPEFAGKTLSKENIDILFPITNNSSMLEGGMGRMLPHELTERQIRLLDYLDGIKGLNIVVKPMFGSNYNNCSVLPVLSRMKNVRIIDHLNLSEVINKYRVRSVLIDYPSTPLHEVITSDMEVFLMNDPLVPYEEQALKELQKRIHYSEDTDEMISLMDRYVYGDLESKRDATYVNHYVLKDDTRGCILKLINSFITAEKFR